MIHRNNIIRLGNLRSALFILLLSVLGMVQLNGQSYGRDFDIAIENYLYFFEKQDYGKAEDQAKNAYKLAKQNNNKSGQAYALNLQAKAQLKDGINSSRKRRGAKKNLEESVVLLAGSSNNSLKRDNYELLKMIAEAENDKAATLIYTDKIRDMNALMTKAEEEKKMKSEYRRLANNKRALETKVKSLSDNVSDLEVAKGISDSMFYEQKLVTDSLSLRAQFDSIMLVQKENAIQQQQSMIALQESQLSLQKSQRNFSYALAGIVTLLLIGMALRYFESTKHNAVLKVKNEIIETERERSEKLLLNILPSLVANELKNSGHAKARNYNNASVLFTDFVKFSAVAQDLKPEELVSVLDYYFTSFDEIISKYKVEKIKTIGDAYMLTSGLPRENPENPVEIVKAAVDIQNFIEKSKIERQKKKLPFFEARIGVHTGPLVAGVVGHTKFAYDVWGDTVNVAARLETNCEPGRVNISATTYEHIKDMYKCEFRGEIPIKNRGKVGMYYIEV